MRIDLRLPLEPGEIDRTQKPLAQALQRSSKPAVPDASSHDLQSSRLEATANSAPEIRQDRVQQLQDTISAGTYSVSDEQLANAMLKDLLNH